jgi:CheY-like chemotaxis protein
MSSQTRVLVVDDEPSIRNSLVEFLQDFQFDVLSADSAEGALDLIARLPIDVAVVDIRLPRLDGDSLILQAHPAQAPNAISHSYRIRGLPTARRTETVRGDPGPCLFQAPGGSVGF